MTLSPASPGASPVADLRLPLTKSLEIDFISSPLALAPVLPAVGCVPIAFGKYGPFCHVLVLLNESHIPRKIQSLRGMLEGGTARFVQQLLRLAQGSVLCFQFLLVYLIVAQQTIMGYSGGLE